MVGIDEESISVDEYNCGDVSLSEGQRIQWGTPQNNPQQWKDRKQKSKVSTNVQKVGPKQGKTHITKQKSQKNVNNLIYCKCLFTNTMTNSFGNTSQSGANKSDAGRKDKHPIVEIACIVCNCPKQSPQNLRATQREGWLEGEQKYIIDHQNNFNQEKQPLSNTQKFLKKTKIIRKTEQPQKKAKDYKNQLKKQGQKKVNRKKRVSTEEGNQREPCESDNNKASLCRKLRKFLERLVSPLKMAQTINKYYHILYILCKQKNVTKQDLRVEITSLCTHMVSIQHGKGAKIDIRSAFQHIDYQFLHGVIKAVLDDTRIDCPKERKALLESISEKFDKAEIQKQDIQEVFLKANLARYIIRQQAYLQFYGKIKYVSKKEENIRSYIRDFTDTLVKFKNGEPLQKRLIKKNMQTNECVQDQSNNGKFVLDGNNESQSHLAINDQSIVPPSLDQSQPLIQYRPYYYVSYDPLFFRSVEQNIPVQIPMQIDEQLDQNSSENISFQISMQIE